MDHAGHKQQFYKRLPRGPIWPAQEGDIPEWDPLIAAITRGFVDIDDRAEELIAEALPTSTGELLPEWEALVGLPDAFSGSGLTEDQRRAEVLAKLRYLGQVNIHDLQETFAALFDDPDVLLMHHLHPAFVAGASGAGDGCGDAFQACWSLEYMDNILIDAPDGFEGWEDTAAVDDAFAQSPITLMQTADRVTLDVLSGDTAAAWSEFTADAGDPIRATIWARTESGSKYFAVGIRDRDGSTIGLIETTLTTTWAKIEVSATIGAGGSDPALIVFGHVSETPQFLLSWAMVGVRRPLLEARCRTLVPLNTAGEFLVKGETPAGLEIVDEDGEILIDEDGEELIDV